MGSLTTREITLQDAPEWLFDPASWAELIHLNGGRDIALDKLNNPDPGIIAFMRRKAIEGSKAKEQDLHDEAIYAQGAAILEGLKSKALGGQIEFKGIFEPTLQEVSIPGDLAQTLSFNFVTGTASSKTHRFFSVKILLPHDLVQDIVEGRCEAWLRNQIGGGSGPLKKILIGDARRKFGDDFTTRMFDRVYLRVLGRSRGRPPSIQ